MLTYCSTKILSRKMKFCYLLGIQIVLVSALEYNVAGEEDPNNLAPITYVESEIYGNMILATGKMLDLEDAFSVVSVKSLSQCRTHCWTYPNCKSYSVSGNEKPLECRLALNGPQDLAKPLVANESATYVYRQDSLTGHVNKLFSDGNLYIVPSISGSFSQAREHCLQFPGFHLAILKTVEQFNILHEIYILAGKLRLYVDLARDREVDSGSLPVWRDGTSLDLDLLEKVDVNYLANRSFQFVFTYFEVLPFPKVLENFEHSLQLLFLCQAYVKGSEQTPPPTEKPWSP